MTHARNLALHSPYSGVRPVIPQHGHDWTRAELDALRADLERRGWLQGNDREAWIAMETNRARRLEYATAYPSNTTPAPAVLATTPIEWRASRRFFNDPQFPLLSHRLHQVVAAITGAAGRATKAEAGRIFAAVHEWNMRVLGTAPVTGARLPGGLCIAIKGDRILLSHLDWTADAPATAGQLSRLRLLVSLWRRLVTRVAAASLRLCTDAHPTAASTLRFALRTKHLEAGHAHVIEDGRVRVRRMQEIACAGDYQLQARLAVARTLTRYTVLINQYRLGLALEEAFAAVPGPAIASLDITVEPVAASEMDDVARRMIVPQLAGEPVGWDATADSYAVLRDTGHPYELARFADLGTAIEFERSNRYEGYGLRLRVAA